MKVIRFIHSLCVACAVAIAPFLLFGAASQQVTARYYWRTGETASRSASATSPLSSPYSAWVYTSKPTATFSALPELGCKAVSWGWTTALAQAQAGNLSAFQTFAWGDSCTWTFDGSLGTSVYLGLEMDWIDYELRYSGGSREDWCYTNEVSVAGCSTLKTGYTFGGSWTNDEGLTVSVGQIVTGATFSLTNHDDSAVVTLYPTWTPDKTSLALDAQGGTGGTTALKATYDAVLPDVTAPTRSGYTFRGFWTAENGSGTQYIDENGQGIRPWTETAVTTLYAAWTENVKYFTVTWKDASSFGGTVLKTEVVASGSEPTAPDDPEHAGYRFDGWSPSVTVIKQNRTFTATYTANSYRVYFNTNGGTGELASRLYTYDTEGVLPANTFTRTGYAFLGWATNATGTVVYPDRAPVFNWSTGASVNLHAVWQANVYTVHYEAGAGAGEMADQSFTYDREQALAANAFTNGELAFLGWQCSNGQEFKDGETVSNLTAVAGGVVTNTARWAQTYKVHFDGNGATNGTAMADQSFADPTDEQSLTPNAYGKRGYLFTGWAKTKGGEKVYEDGQKVKGLAEAGETVTLYACWTPVSYFVAFDAGGGVVSTPMVTVSALYGEPFALPDLENHFTPANPDLDCFDVWQDALNGATYTNRATVSNLCAVAGATNVLKATWKLDVGEWSEHAHCTTLRWSVKNKGWGYVWKKNAGAGYGFGESGSSIGQVGKGSVEDRDWLEAVVRTNGTLRFQCRWRKGEGSTKPRVMLYLALSQTGDTFFSDGYASTQTYPALTVAGEWIEVTLPVTLVGDDSCAYVHAVSYIGSDEDEIEIDQIVWTPEGASAPVYAETDTPIGSFGASGETLSFAFSGSGTYHLLGTNDLTAPMPWPVVFATNVTGGAEIVVPKKEDEEAMFYRIRALK